MSSAETTSRGVSSRPRCRYRAITSLQIKLGRFCENSNAASLALSIKASEGLSERVRAGSAEGDGAGGGSGQGGRSACLPRLRMGGALEQAGVLCAGDCVGGGADCAGCDCGEGPTCEFTEIGALRKRARSAPSRQLNLRLEKELRMITPMIHDFQSGAPGETRTPDPLVRSPMLYPAELRARKAHDTRFGRGRRNHRRPDTLHGFRRRRCNLESKFLLAELRMRRGQPHRSWLLLGANPDRAGAADQRKRIVADHFRRPV
jgi:hypothetical protein